MTSCRMQESVPAVSGSRRTARAPGQSMLLAVVAALVLAGAAACGGAQSSAGPVGPHVATALNHDTESFDVAGIHVIHKRTPGNATVAVQVFVDGGVAYSGREIAGADDLAIGVVTSGGPASMAKVDYTAAVAAMGSSIGGSSGYDYAVLSMGAIETYFEPTWEIFVETLLEPAWRDGDLELRRELALTSLRTELDNPDGAAGVLAKEIAFAGHPYAVRPQGWIETVSALDVGALREAWSRLLVKSRLTVVVVGNVERRELERLVHDAFADLPADLEPPFERPTTGGLAFDHATVTVEERVGLPTNYVLGYFAGPPVEDPDYPALQAGLEILSDRLFEEVRTRRNLSYAVASGLSDRRAVTGYLYVTAVQANETLRVMLETVDGLIDPGVGEQDLHDQIEGYLTRYYQGLQSNAAQASLLGQWHLRGGREHADVHLARLAEVTAEDVSRVLQRYVSNIQFVVVGDPAAVDSALFMSR